MIRSTLITLATAALALGTAPAMAQTPTYRAVPASTPANARSIVIGDTLWSCGEGGCTTTRATSRPAVVCEQAAKKIGKLESFTVGTATFDEAALAKCNAKARG